MENCATKFSLIVTVHWCQICFTVRCDFDLKMIPREMTTGLSRGGEERGKYACTQPLSVWRAPTLDERWLRLMPLAAYWLLPANQGQVFLQSSARKNYSDSSNVFLSVNPKTGFKSCNGFCVPFGKSKSGFLMFWILFEKGFIEFEIRRIRIQINGLVIYAVPFTVQGRS